MSKLVDTNGLEIFKNKLEKQMPKSLEITEAIYNTLTDEQKKNGTVYYVKDKSGGGGGTSILTLSAQPGNILEFKIDGLYGGINSISDEDIIKIINQS